MTFRDESKKTVFIQQPPTVRSDVKRTAFGRILASELPSWVLIVFSRKIVCRLRSICIGRMLGAKGMSVGPDCSFYGTRSIQFGRGISAHSGLWLEAVVQYGKESFTPRLLIGDRVKFSDRVHVSCIHRVEIRADVLIGSSVYISDHNHGAYQGVHQSCPDEPPAERRLYAKGQVIIEENVWIGDHVVVIGDVRIGRGAIIAANSVITRDVAPGTIVGGAPGRQLREYGCETLEWR